MRKLSPWILTGALTITMAISSIIYSDKGRTVEEQLKLEKFRVEVLHKIIQENDSVYKKNIRQLTFKNDSLITNINETNKSKTFIIELNKNGNLKYNYYFKVKDQAIRWEITTIGIDKAAPKTHLMLQKNGQRYWFTDLATIYCTHD